MCRPYANGYKMKTISGGNVGTKVARTGKGTLKTTDQRGLEVSPCNIERIRQPMKQTGKIVGVNLRQGG